MGKMTELVKERFEAIAHKALLQGLHNSLPMKPTTVEWVEQIPTHWTQKRFKFVGLVRSWKTEESYGESPRYGRYSRGRFPVSLEEERFDLAVTRRGMKAKPFEGEEPKSLLLIELCQNQNLHYWRFYLNSHFAQSWLKRESAMNESLTIEMVRNLPVFEPPLEEQVQIAQFLTAEAQRTQRLLEIF
jgi:type I restriction enzyme S subunit